MNWNELERCFHKESLFITEERGEEKRVQEMLSLAVQEMLSLACVGLCNVKPGQRSISI